MAVPQNYSLPARDKYGSVIGGGTGSIIDSLDGADRDAALALSKLFESYGLGSLSNTIVKYLKDGFSSDTITVLLQGTPEYKKRFAANDVRLKAGLPALSPAEYISTERSYRQIMQGAGLPIGFYDQASDFQKFLEMDVSPTEVQSRVQTVADAINKAPKDTTDYFKNWYGTGDMIAYALDPKKAQPLIEQRIKAAEAAAMSGGKLSRTNAETIGSTGASFDQLQQGVGFISQEQNTTDKLSNIYAGEDVDQSDLVAEVFQNSGNAARKRKSLASQERGTFSGAGAQGKTSLNKSSGGSL